MIDWLAPMVVIGAALVLFSILTSVLAFRFGAPLLLVFLLIGLVAGEDGLGLAYDDQAGAFFIGSIALAVILFDAGFGTRLSAFRRVAAPALGLATVGVVLTTGLVGVAAHWLFDLTWPQALLLGAVISSTDAAAVFFLLRAGGITLRSRVRGTLGVESGSNDPIAIFLTVTLVELVLHPAGLEAFTGALAVGFGLQMGLGIALGLLGGYVLNRLMNAIELETGLYPVFVLVGALLVFGATTQLGGSGFVAAYVAGLVAGNRQVPHLATLATVSGRDDLARPDSHVPGAGAAGHPLRISRHRPAGDRAWPVSDVRGTTAGRRGLPAAFSIFVAGDRIHRLGGSARGGVHPAGDSAVPRGSGEFAAVLQHRFHDGAGLAAGAGLDHQAGGALAGDGGPATPGSRGED